MADTFLITRPRHQAEPLLQLLHAAGQKAVAFPVMSIHSKTLSEKEQGHLAALQQYDLVFFISANAVHESMPLVQRQGGFSSKTKVAVIGPATQSALKDYGIVTDIISSTLFNSEGLLAEAALQQVSGKNVLIFRGVGGRTLLANTLIQRGAKVDSIESYTREVPDDAAPVTALLPSLAAIVVMSNESLDNLCTLLGSAAELKFVPLVVISARTASHAHQQGLSAIIAESPSDQAVFQCLMRIQENLDE